MSTRIRFQFDVEKTIEVILYIADKCPDMYTSLKILYFADKDHLAKYGRFIGGDNYCAMKDGPVPSGAYDIVKHVRGDGYYPIADSARLAFVMEPDDKTYRLLRQANTEKLSKSDRECLDSAITKYCGFSFRELKKISHDDAYDSVDANNIIPVEEIARTLPDGEILIDYLRNEA